MIDKDDNPGGWTPVDGGLEMGRSGDWYIKRATIDADGFLWIESPQSLCQLGVTTLRMDVLAAVMRRAGWTVTPPGDGGAS